MYVLHNTVNSCRRCEYTHPRHPTHLPTQADTKPGCVLRSSNVVEVLQRKRGLLTNEDVETCKGGMNTWGYVGDLNDHPQLSCVYQSDDAQNEFLSNPKVSICRRGPYVPILAFRHLFFGARALVAGLKRFAVQGPLAIGTRIAARCLMMVWVTKPTFPRLHETDMRPNLDLIRSHQI